jgi:chemotaxis protein MotB
MKIKNLILAGIVISTVGSACVSTQKYNDMTTARDHYKAEHQNLKAVEQENEALKNQLRVAENQLKLIKDGIEKQKKDLARLQAESKEMAARYDSVLGENANLLSNYSTGKMSLEEKLAANEEQIRQQERQLLGLENTLGMQSYGMESMRSNLASREQRVAELEKLLAEKEAQMAKLRLSLQEALTGISDADLSVTERDGKIYVSLSQNLLFKSGSDEVDPGGKKALAQLAKALSDNPGIEIIVEGHTDHAGSVNYNWDLSTRRATAVVKLLAINGVAPSRLTAAGRGMHHPIVPNDTPENKARNRRTDIILSPNLDKLIEMTK